MSVISTPRNGSATVNGRGISHRNLNRQQRANLAADVVTGARGFVPSCEQACVLFGIPRYVLSRHLRGRRKFAARHPELAAGNGKTENGNGNGAALVAALRGSNAAERVAAAREIGIDTIWDTLIVPVLREDKAVTP
jgi:hypothetical protein